MRRAILLLILVYVNINQSSIQCERAGEQVVSRCVLAVRPIFRLEADPYRIPGNTRKKAHLHHEKKAAKIYFFQLAKGSLMTAVRVALLFVPYFSPNSQIMCAKKYIRSNSDRVHFDKVKFGHEPFGEFQIKFRHEYQIEFRLSCNTMSISWQCRIASPLARLV